MSDRKQLKNSITPTHVLGSTGTTDASELGYTSMDNLRELVGVSDLQIVAQHLTGMINELFTRLIATEESITSLTAAIEELADVKDRLDTLESVTSGEDALALARFKVDRLIKQTTTLQNQFINFAMIVESSELTLNALESQLGDRTLETAVSELNDRLDTLGSVTSGEDALTLFRFQVDWLIKQTTTLQNQFINFAMIAESSELTLNALESQLGNRTLETAVSELNDRIEALEED